MNDRLAGLQVVVVSRCSWTLYNFRRTLIHALKKGGAKVTALGGADHYADRLSADGISFAHVPVSRRGIDPIGDLRLLSRLTRLFSRQRPSIVHSFTIKPVVYGTIAAALARVPVRVVTITGLGHAFTSGSGLLRVIARGLYKISLRFAQVVFFQNSEDRDLFFKLKLVDPAKAHLVPGSGVDLEKFHVVPLPSATGSMPVFIMLSRLIREKGVAEFLAAAKITKQRVPSARFILLGGIDSRNPTALSAADVEQLRTSQDVEWIDEVADVRPYLQRADVVVLPSYREGLPRALLEGAAMGRALIATDVPGCRSVVIDKQTGLLVSPASSDALSAAMLKLTQDPSTLVAMGANARKFVESNFDERLVIERTIAEYRRAAAAKGVL